MDTEARKVTLKKHQCLLLFLLFGETISTEHGVFCRFMVHKFLRFIEHSTELRDRGFQLRGMGLSGSELMHGQNRQIVF